MPPAFASATRRSSRIAFSALWRTSSAAPVECNVTGPSAPLDHEKLLRRSFAVARRALTNGNHPFGAILMSEAGDVLLEAENGYMPDRDMTGHAERLLATAAPKQF